MSKQGKEKFQNPKFKFQTKMKIRISKLETNSNNKILLIKEICFAPLLADTFVRPKRTQYDIAMSDCFEYSVSSQ